MNAFVAVLSKYLGSSETGQLVVQFAEIENLCKISIEQGQAVYLSIGNMMPEETLDFIAGKTPSKAKFIPGVTARKKLAAPINDRLLALAGGPATEEASGAAPPIPPVVVTGSGSVSPEKTSQVIEDFIDIVGPLGTVLARKILEKIGGSADSEMSVQLYAAFLSMLHAEVPVEQQEEFLRRHQN